jgi:hypothetical protein
MDPMTTLNLMLQAGDPLEALTHAVDLLSWFAEGGATPNGLASKLNREAPKMLDDFEDMGDGDDDDA